jgi:hypothetical protein
MTGTLLLVLLGLVASAEPRSDGQVSDRRDAPVGPAGAAESGDPALKQTPLAAGASGPGSLVQPIRPFRLVRRPSDAGLTRLGTPGPLTTCTIRIVPALPSLDPGSVRKREESRSDPIVRDELSPCAER